MAKLRLRGFTRDAKGATAIEFGLLAVPFLGLFAMIFDVGLSFFYARNLDAAVQHAARQVRTGAVQGAAVTTTKAFVANYLCPPGGVMASFITCANLIVDVRTSTSFTGVDVTNDFYKTPTTNQFCLGAPHTITIVRVAYPMPWFLPVVTAGGVASNAGLVNDVPNQPGWKLLLISASAVRTEPYPNAQYSAYVAAKGC